MTIKKNYERDSGELRKPKSRGVNNRDEARVKHALRHGDFDALYADELDDMGVVNYEDDDE